MMARQHVTFATGLTGTGLVTASYAFDDVAQWVADRPAEPALMLLLIAGGALVPDLDHHGSTITRKLGWVGWILHRVLGVLGVRHRGFLHSFLFAALSGALFFGLEALIPVNEYVAIGLGLLLLFYASITFGFIFGRLGRQPVLVLALGAGMVYGYTEGVITFGSHWVAIGAFLGPLMHDLGDSLTHGKVPLWYPFSRRNYGSPLTFRTGSLFESFVLRGVFFVWSLLAFAFIVLMWQGLLVRTDFGVVAQGESWSEKASSLQETLPYVMWTLENPQLQSR